MYTGQFLRLGVGGRTGYTTKKRLLDLYLHSNPKSLNPFITFLPSYSGSALIMREIKTQHIKLNCIFPVGLFIVRCSS